MRMALKDDPKAYAIMGCAMRVHSILGCGFLESAYGDAHEIEFKKAGISYVREDSVRIHYDGQPLPTNWRADFTCFNRSYIVELKHSAADASDAELAAKAEEGIAKLRQYASDPFVPDLARDRKSVV